MELTFTSNAIEGNTLTLRETAEVIEHGITVGGKTLKEHLEAVDHYEAVLWRRERAAQTAPIGDSVVRELHRRIVARSEPEIGGVYSPHRRRIAGSPVVFPNPLKVPDLMEVFGRSLEHTGATPEAAFDAHFRLTAIHSFSASKLSSAHRSPKTCGRSGCLCMSGLTQPWRSIWAPCARPSRSPARRR